MNIVLQHPYSSMASSNPKPLNPCALPYMKSVINPSPPPPPPITQPITIPSKPLLLPHQIYEHHPQQPPQPAVPTVTMNHVIPASYFYVQHQYCTQAWAYPAEAMAFYNIHRQPYHVAYSQPYYVNCGEKGIVRLWGDDLKESGAEVVEDAVKLEGCYAEVVLGHNGKRVYYGGRRSIAPRLRSKRTNCTVDSQQGKQWVPKTDTEFCGNDGDFESMEKAGVLACAFPGDEALLAGNTSLMIKNIPNQLGRRDLLRILDEHCWEENQKLGKQLACNRSEYDFLYLPMDFVKRANLGYAFVNFTNDAGAIKFRKGFNNYKWDVPANRKICEISLAKIQGKDALRNHFRTSLFRCHTNAYLPVMFSPPRDGCNDSNPIIVGKRVDSTLPSTRASDRQRKIIFK